MRVVSRHRRLPSPGRHRHQTRRNGIRRPSRNHSLVSLGLEEVGGELLGPVAVKEGEGGREGRGGDAPEGGLGDDASPAGLGLVDGLVEEVVEQERLELGLLAEGGGDVTQEDAVGEVERRGRG